ncbi:hypothetical protein [Burkholderia pyrrocinia]
MATVLCMLYPDPVDGGFDAAMIARMKRGAYLFDTARAKRVDRDAHARSTAARPPRKFQPRLTHSDDRSATRVPKIDQLVGSATGSVLLVIVFSVRQQQRFGRRVIHSPFARARAVLLLVVYAVAYVWKNELDFSHAAGGDARSADWTFPTSRIGDSPFREMDFPHFGR